MGYRVEYGPTTQKKRADRGTGGRRAWLTAAFLALFLVLVNICWPQGREVLNRLLWPGDAGATRQAAESFVEELRSGEPLGDAVEGFCREVLRDANLDG